MLRIGMIGTSSIAHEFAKALTLSKRYDVKAIYSRSLEKAEEFGQPYGSTLFFDDLNDLLSSEEIDVVYIASPNSLHYDQAVAALNHHKHVIVEKPAFSNMKEWTAAFDLAAEKGVFLFEAARHIHDKNFQLIKNEIAKLPHIDGAILHFGKYSSRYDQVLAGEDANIFSLKFSGGALMDLGVYLIYAALSWFGEPESGQYIARKIKTGVDGTGTIIFRYADYDVVMHVSKISNLSAPSEVQSGKQTLVMDGVSVITSVELDDTETNQRQQLILPTSDHLMVDEAIAFAEVIESADSTESQAKYQEWKQLSYDVSRWIETLRKEAGIYFDADNE